MSAFTIGTAARGDSFYGRETELKVIREHSWVWICGQRRIGKTSLLLRAVHEAKEAGWHAFYFDLSRLRPDHTSSDLVHKFLRAQKPLLLKLGHTWTDFLDDGSPEEAFGDLARTLADEGGQTLIAFDEAERLIDINKSDPSFLDALAGQLRTLHGFKLLIAGTQTVAELFPDDDRVSSFIGGFKWQPLTGLDEQSARDLLNCRGRDCWSSPLPIDLVNAVMSWSGGHPLILQEIGDCIYQQSGGDGSKVTDSSLERCKKAIVSNAQLQRIFANDQKRLTPEQRAVLQAVCQTGEGLPVGKLAHETGKHEWQVEQAASFLENFGYLNIDDRVILRYQFYLNFLEKGDADGSLTNSQKVARLKRTLFISYSHKDREMQEQFLKFLNPLVRQNDAVCFWTDRDIESGEIWNEEIEKSLDEAAVGLLMITQNFLNSTYIEANEIPRLLQKWKEGKLRLLCLYISPSNVDKVKYPLGQEAICLTNFQGLNDPKSPLTMVAQPEQEQALVEISKAVVDSLLRQ
jgi:hypothetical protein